MTDGHDARDDDDVDDAQQEYDTDPALQELLTQAAHSPTVRRDNADDGGDGDDAHRQRVHDSVRRALDEQADLLERFKREDRADVGNDAGDTDDGAAWVDRP